MNEIPDAEGGGGVEQELVSWLNAWAEAFKDAWDRRTPTGTTHLEHEGFFFLSAADGAESLSRDRAAEMLGGAIKYLEDEKFDHEVLVSHEVRVLNPSAALIDAEWARYRSDGTEFQRPSSSYLVARGDEGWKVVALIPR